MTLPIPDLASDTPSFADITAETPTAESLAATHAGVIAALGEGRPEEALLEWEAARREYETWRALVDLRFAQDTRSEQARADRDYADTLAPTAFGYETDLKRRFLADPEAAALVPEHARALWRADIGTFDPVIAADLQQEAKLAARYTELLAGAEIPFGGTLLNLAGLDAPAQSPDRATRHDAEAARWAFFQANGPELDALYDELVRLRHGMARKLGDDSFTALAYRRMRRTDWGPAQAARYRDEVRARVTPLVARLLEERRRRHGWDRLRFWDEALIDPGGNPKPAGEEPVLLAAAQAMFDAMDRRLGSFFRMMTEGGFLDLENRPGKAGGGFCTAFPNSGAPFIFANFNGTDHDINVFTHEMGHAFQVWESRRLPLLDLLWPTSEAAEIDSMALEFLTYPHLDPLVEPGAGERFRRMHLIQALAFLPYGVCVDHFQHEVYAAPEASPEERHAMWRRLERLYMPWTDYGDLDYPARGGRWQAKQHIYLSPFYYIDYTLAQCCALQFWVRSRADRAGALDAYVALCGRGGSAPFSGLVASAGLDSPFEPGALAAAVQAAEAALGM
jgi:M3 family oligoendopeptidase